MNKLSVEQQILTVSTNSLLFEFIAKDRKRFQLQWAFPCIPTQKPSNKQNIGAAGYSARQLNLSYKLLCQSIIFAAIRRPMSIKFTIRAF